MYTEHDIDASDLDFGFSIVTAETADIILDDPLELWFESVEPTFDPDSLKGRL